MHFLGTHEGKGRGSRGKQGRCSSLTRGEKKRLNGGFGNITSFLSDVKDSPFWGNLCEKEGHRYHSCTGLCVRCGKSKDDTE